MTTVTDLIEETRGHLVGFHKADLNRVASTVTDSTGTVVLAFTDNPVPRNTTICVGDELMYVYQVSGATLTVERGYLGTTPAAHAVGDIVEVSPRFATPMIRKALKDEIASWGRKIWRAVEVQLDAGATNRAYDLEDAPGGFLAVLRVRRAPVSGERAPVSVPFHVMKGYSDYDSGVALVLNKDLPQSATLSVLYSVRFDLSDFDDDTDLVDDLEIPETALDIPPLGAAWRLLATREVARTAIESAPEPRQATDVPPGHIIQTATQLKRIRDERIGEEGRALLMYYGVRKA